MIVAFKKILAGRSGPIIILSIREAPFLKAVEAEERLRVMTNPRSNPRVVDKADCVVSCTKFVNHPLEDKFLPRARKHNVTVIRLGTTSSLVRAVLEHRGHGRKEDIVLYEQEPPIPKVFAKQVSSGRILRSLDDESRKLLILELNSNFVDRESISTHPFFAFFKNHYINRVSFRNWLTQEKYIESATRGSSGKITSWKPTNDFHQIVASLNTKAPTKSKLEELKELDGQRANLVASVVDEIKSAIADMDRRMEDLVVQMGVLEAEKKGLEKQRDDLLGQ